MPPPCYYTTKPETFPVPSLNWKRPWWRKVQRRRSETCDPPPPYSQEPPLKRPWWKKVVQTSLVILKKGWADVVGYFDVCLIPLWSGCIQFIEDTLWGMTIILFLTIFLRI